MQWSLILIILGLEIKYTQGIWPPSYKVYLKDKQTFVISSDEDYEENENEMIQQEDLSEIESFAEDESKYKPLHSHVKNYNRIAAEKADELSRSIFFQSIPESPFKEETKPFTVGLKSKLDKYVFENLENPVHSLKKRFPNLDTTIKNSFKKLFSTTTAMKNPGYVKNNHKRIKRNEEDDPFESTDSSTEFFEGIRSRKSPIAETTESEITESVQSQFTEFSSTKIYMKDAFRNLDLTTIRPTDSEMYEYQDEVEETILNGSTEKINLDQFVERTTTSNIEISEDYNYDNLKVEYYQQIEEIKRKNGTFNYMDRGEPEDTANDAIKRIVDLKMPRNCTKEELSPIGVKAFECLAYDYKHTKNKTDIKKVFKRTWMVIKVWFFIYTCIAIPCWCQRGWCCCCFCCKICFPKEMIEAEKKYYAENPPGTLVRRIKEDNIVKMETEKYKPTLFEYETYEIFESAIRNI